MIWKSLGFLLWCSDTYTFLWLLSAVTPKRSSKAATLPAAPQWGSPTSAAKAVAAKEKGQVHRQQSNRDREVLLERERRLQVEVHKKNNKINK